MYSKNKFQSFMEDLYNAYMSIGATILVTLAYIFFINLIKDIILILFGG